VKAIEILMQVMLKLVLVETAALVIWWKKMQWRTLVLTLWNYTQHKYFFGR